MGLVTKTVIKQRSTQLQIRQNWLVNLGAFRSSRLQSQQKNLSVPTTHPVESRNAVKLFLGAVGRRPMRFEEERTKELRVRWSVGKRILRRRWRRRRRRPRADGLFGRAPRSPRSIRLRLATRGNSPLVGVAADRQAGGLPSARLPGKRWRGEKKVGKLHWFSELAHEHSLRWTGGRALVPL